ncbi:hypothetical protein PSAKL28_30220 [Pseudomonas alkylphenolica]|uniref:Uncharacterized protein n=1 Tax=Pseudomonas alkylphenolica TaxID=237609 RepID=A0A077F9X3_9PSED|nr:hypothetical protein PSAKL28_30220 [Pseudomonas alkylphenolica]
MSPPSAMACTSPAARVAGRIEGAFLPGQIHGLLIGTLYVRPEGSPGALRARCQETLRGRRCSPPVPAGETTGSFCARMCAERYRPQPRNGSGAICSSDRR